MKNLNGIFVLVLVLVSFIFNSAIAQNASSTTISRTVSVGDMLNLSIDGDITYKVCKGTRVIVETKITTNFPPQVHEVLKNRWMYLVKEESNVTTISLEIPNKLVVYQGTALIEKVETTIYIPEHIRTRVL